MMADRSIQIRGLVKEYRAGVPVLKGIDLDIAGDGITAIIGPSGTGKSTLIRCINRLIEPSDGQILFHAHHRVGQDRQHHSWAGARSDHDR